MSPLDHVAKRMRRTEDGSALILALIIVVVVGLMMTAVLSFAGDSLTTTPKLRDLRNQTDYASGAVQGAVDSIRSSSVLGSTRTTCPTYFPGATTSDPGADGHSFAVSCRAQDTSGGGQPDQPNWAIQTLGTAAGEGVNDSSGNGLLTIDGGVYSNRQISVGGGAANVMQIIGSAYAEGSCTPLARITTTDVSGPRCNYTDSTHLGDDPNYVSAVGNAAALTELITSAGADPAPTCPTASVVRFAPGYYSETPATLLANLAPSCAGSAWWFKPGKYYFNYDGNWDVGTVIAGTPHGNWVTGTSSPALDGTDCDAVQPGVQFIFGGATTVTVGHMHAFEICGPVASQQFTGAPQHIVVFGLKSGSAPSTQTATLTADQTPTSVNPHALTPAVAAQTIDGLSAVAAIAANQTATLAYSSFNDVPTGAHVTGALLTVNATVPKRTAAQVVVTTASHPSGQTISVPSGCSAGCDLDISAALSAPYWRDLNSLTLRYVATGAGNLSGVATPSVDGIALSTTYTAPALQQLQCTTACTFFDASVPDVTVYVHGTVYTPTAGWNLELQNKSDALFDRGVVVRTLTLNNNPSFKQTDSPFQLPNAGPFDRQVLFTATFDGVPKTRACVLYTDHTTLPDGSRGPAFPGYRVTVQRWSALRADDGQGSPSCG
ncbi:MAG: hypothetical protein ACJ735_05290 [Actinomycetes bacterium]